IRVLVNRNWGREHPFNKDQIAGLVETVWIGATLLLCKPTQILEHCGVIGECCLLVVSPLMHSLSGRLQSLFCGGVVLKHLIAINQQCALWVAATFLPRHQSLIEKAPSAAEHRAHLPGGRGEL